MTYFVGVDSGGTHTNIRVADPNGPDRAVPELNRSLTSNRSDTELARTFQDILSSVRGSTRGNPVAVWINAAGYSAPTRRRFDKLLQDAAGDFGGPIGMANDAVSLLLAHEPELVVVIAGTGSVAMARQASGEVITRGGDEWVVADYGSAFWMGLEGIRAAYRALEGGLETALLPSLIEEFAPLHRDISRRTLHEAVSEIARDLAALGTDTKPKIAAFAKQVTRQAELGDDEAQKIVRTAVDELADAAARVYREVAARAHPREVVPRFLLNGSVAFRSRFYAEAFEASLHQFLFDVRESTGHEVSLQTQLNGLGEAVSLARRLVNGDPLPELNQSHPHSYFE